MNIPDDFVVLDGFDAAIMGVVHRIDAEDALLYDFNKCVNILMERDNITMMDAVEWMDYNICGAFMGPNTPAFYRPLDDFFSG